METYEKATLATGLREASIPPHVTDLLSEVATRLDAGEPMRTSTSSGRPHQLAVGS